MENSKVDLLISTYADKFKPEHIMAIRQKLETMPDDSYTALQVLPLKSPMIGILLGLFLGGLGVDRFYAGNTGLGIAKLLTCGGFGIWTIVDLFLIMDAVRDANYETFVTHVR